MIIHHIGVSGGKDSAACLLWAVHESGLPKESLRATFCDTGNEHQLTYDHVRLLSETVFPIETIMPERDFYELAKWKSRFPSPKARFCTQHLKMFPSRKYCQALSEQPGVEKVILLSGVRGDESADRAKLPEREFDGFYGMEVWRPLLSWKFADVLAIHQRHNLALNPLYGYGAQRVGCFPCVMSRKAEIRMIAKNFPERIDRIRQAENETKSTSLGMFSSFFHRKIVPEAFRSKLVKTKDGREMRVATIDDVVKWSKTERGGKQYDIDFSTFSVCSSQHGSCE